ncbi:hypothetical protein Hanom_Chr16g01418091 [Helianthus anomalus]
MNITANRNRTLHRLNIIFLHKYSPSLITKTFHLQFRQRFALHQLLYLPIYIRMRRHLHLFSVRSNFRSNLNNRRSDYKISTNL